MSPSPDLLFLIWFEIHNQKEEPRESWLWNELACLGCVWKDKWVDLYNVDSRLYVESTLGDNDLKAFSCDRCLWWLCVYLRKNRYKVSWPLTLSFLCHQSLKWFLRMIGQAGASPTSRGTSTRSWWRGWTGPRETSWASWRPVPWATGPGSRNCWKREW